MLSTVNTCLHCGTINRAAEPVCVTCGGGLAVDPFALPQKSPDYEPAADPDLLANVQPFSITEALTSTLSLFTKHFWLIAKLVFVIVTPLEILKATTLADVIHEPQVRAVTGLLGVVCNVVIAPALIYALTKEIQTGEDASVKESFSWGLSKIPHFAFCAAVAYFLQGVGYLLCIIPGIIIGLKYAVVYPVAILENQTIREVFGRSNDLTRGSRLEILATQILVGTVILIATFALTLLMNAVNFAPLSVIASVLIDIAEQLPTLLAFVLYLGLVKSNQLTGTRYSKN